MVKRALWSKLQTGLSMQHVSLSPSHTSTCDPLSDSTYDLMSNTAYGGFHKSVLMMFIGVFMSIMIGVLLSIPAVAYADAFGTQTQSGGSSVVNDVHTGNLFVINAPVANKEIGTDFYWAGSTLQASNLTVGTQGNGSACVAGSELSFTNSTINGSLRPAGQTISITKTEVENNITAAGMTITTGSDVTAKGLYIAGRTIKAGGTYLGASLSGYEVVFSATVEGDVAINADTITITSDAVVAGVLSVPENAHLDVAEGASIGEIVKRPVSEMTGESASGIALNADWGSLLPFGSIMWMAMVAFALVSHSLLTALFTWVGRRPIERMAIMTRDRMGLSCLCGFLAFLVMPIVLIILSITVVGLPIAALLGIIMVTTWLFAIPLAGAALGIHFSKGNHPYSGALIATAILTAICWLPGCLTIVPTVCTMYCVGCWIQMGYLRYSAAHVKLPPIPQDAS